MKTLVGTPDPPEPEPQKYYNAVIWSSTNATGWVVWHPPYTLTFTC